MSELKRPAPIPLDDAIMRLLAYAQPCLKAEAVSTFEADGRVLAQAVVSPLTVPPHDSSAMDGYAVRVADCAAPGVLLPVSQRIPAGQVGVPLAPGTAARIFTGAPVPEGADAVVMQEEAQALDPESGADVFGRVRINVAPASGCCIRRAGEDVRSGSVVLAAGQRLTPAALGLAASVGCAQLQVARRPRVALLSTGDELAMPGEIAPEAMPPGAIYNSNRFFLRALLRRQGCEVRDLGVTPDRYEATLAALREAAAHSDVIVTTGGVSVGEEDHIKAAVQALGTLELWSLAIKPGKPFAYGRIGAAHLCALPGNPVASFVTFLLLVRPFLLRLQGATQTAPCTMMVRAGSDGPRAGARREFLRARIGATGALELFLNQSSGVLSSVVWGEGLIDVPPNQPFKAGDMVRFIPFAPLLA
ncbi:MAG: molybdopterin molybdotransferase MoeA [Burkholderiaceae bacterium]|jgi:molybdopterin molybdotransferase|nr:molybdopterin molybdotransferase MoeA [Burkholderiaceae bacterium]